MTRSFKILMALAASLIPCQASAGEWTVDSAKSQLGFTGTMARAPFTGQFQHWNAAISFDPEHPEAGHALVKVDMTSAVTGDKQKDTALPQSDWFDAKTFPDAVFEVSSFNAKSGSSYDAIATLTMRGVRKDVTAPLSIEISGDTMHAKGGLKLVRSDFGVGQGQWTSAQWVALEVAAAFDVTATRKR